MVICATLHTSLFNLFVTSIRGHDKIRVQMRPTLGSLCTISGGGGKGEEEGIDDTSTKRTGRSLYGM